MYMYMYMYVKVSNKLGSILLVERSPYWLRWVPFRHTKYQKVANSTDFKSLLLKFLRRSMIVKRLPLIRELHIQVVHDCVVSSVPYHVECVACL